VSLGVHLLHVLGVDAGGDVLGEVLLVFLLILLREGVHVLSDVTTEDVLLVDISVELTVGETWEALW